MPWSRDPISLWPRVGCWRTPDGRETLSRALAESSSHLCHCRGGKRWFAAGTRGRQLHRDQSQVIAEVSAGAEGVDGTQDGVQHLAGGIEAAFDAVEKVVVAEAFAGWGDGIGDAICIEKE